MLVMVAAFSRFIAAVMLPSRQTMDLVAGMWQLLSTNFLAVPHELWWDNETGIGRRGRLTDPGTALMGTLGSRLVQLKPYDPESKGMVERANAIWKLRFCPGAALPHRRTSMINLGNGFRPPTRDGCGSSTVVPSTSSTPIEPRCCPCHRVAPTVETVTSVRLGRDYYVRVAGNDYSVDPTAIGQLVEVHTALAAVTVRRAGRLMAAHDRCWATRQTLTDPTHVATASALRQQFQTGPPPTTGDQLVRDLADYDRAFGVDFTTAAVASDGEVA